MESAGDGTLAMRCAYPLQGYRSGRDTECHGNEFAVGFFLWGPAREAGPKENLCDASYRRRVMVPSEQHAFHLRSSDESQ